MKKLFFTSLLFLTLAVCKSPEKLIEQGNYDAAIDKSIKMILKGKADNEDKTLLEKAYSLANQRDQDNARLLITENKPENWEEIYHLYTKLSDRQSSIQKVLPLEIHGRAFQYKFIDYAPSIVEAKKRAAEYFYNSGNALMKLQEKESYRQAYYNFLKVKEYRASDYPDIEELIRTSEELGITRVQVEIIDRAQFSLPADFQNNVLNLNTSQMFSDWVDFDFGRGGNDSEYDYFISIVIGDIFVSPENISTEEFIRRKTIQDGFQTELDRHGNVKKDSLGREIKVPKYREITCRLIVKRQSKSAEVHGSVEFVEAPNNLLQRVPVMGTSHFENISGRAVGNRDALEPDDYQLIQNGFVPFPEDFSMIYDCSHSLRQEVSDAVYRNRGLIH
jgi:hypothetical protein